MNRGKIEILAPAGSMETLVAALRTGADAVYAGGKKFSARSSASNFTLDELTEAAEKCRLYGAKLYLAVNTIISDDETDEFCEYIKAAAKLGIDAFIVQDWGAAELIRRCVPDAVLHASTQMTVHTAHGAALLKELGYSRVVPSRELSKTALKKICNKDIETEIFVHGALCMSVSGQCYMSAVIGSRSANRGCCGQACRLPFSSCGNKDAASLSLKDLSLIPHFNELAEIGADSLKIEGRMKRPEYVASAVNALKETSEGKAPDMQLLRGIFSRGGFTDGYFTGKLCDMFGVREKNDVISAQTLIPGIHGLYRSERKTRKISFHAVIKANQPVRITASCGSLSVSEEAAPPEIARSRPTDKEQLEKQLSRLGDTVFALDKVTAEIDEGLVVPAGKLNELRRTLTEKLSKLIISDSCPKYHITAYRHKKPSALSGAAGAELPLRAVCRTAEQIKAAYPLAEYVIASPELLTDDSLRNIDKNRVIVSPPRFITDEDELLRRLEHLYSCGFTHLLCHTPDSIAIGRKLGFTLHGGFGLNVFNSVSAEYLANLGLTDFTVSFEAKVSQINEISSEIPMGVLIYGRLPLMLTRNCPIRNEVGCADCSGKITDRTGRSFPVVCSGEYTEILNSDVLYMFDKIQQLRSPDFGIVMLSEESAAQTAAALKGERPSAGITRGLYYRGI